MGSQPQQLVFDGTNIWSCNFNDATVTKLRASDGSVQGTFTVGYPQSIAFDGVDLWVANSGENTVMKLSQDGKKLGKFPVGVTPIRSRV